MEDAVLNGFNKRLGGIRSIIEDYLIAAQVSSFVLLLLSLSLCVCVWP
jgi:hypothetical protein